MTSLARQVLNELHVWRSEGSWAFATSVSLIIGLSEKAKKAGRELLLTDLSPIAIEVEGLINSYGLESTADLIPTKYPFLTTWQEQENSGGEIDGYPTGSTTLQSKQQRGIEQAEVRCSVYIPFMFRNAALAPTLTDAERKKIDKYLHLLVRDDVVAKLVPQFEQLVSGLPDVVVTVENRPTY